VVRGIVLMTMIVIMIVVMNKVMCKSITSIQEIWIASHIGCKLCEVTFRLFDTVM
jgi:hypothetical protein